MNNNPAAGPGRLPAQPDVAAAWKWWLTPIEAERVRELEGKLRRAGRLKTPMLMAMRYEFQGIRNRAIKRRAK